MPQIVGEGAVPRAQVGGERDVRLLLSPTLFALVAATVTAALATKGARARRTELCCGRGSTAWGAVNAAAVGADHTTTRRGQGVGHARQTMLPGARLRQTTSAPCGHKYHATLLRPPRASSPPALAGRACLCKGEEGSRTWGKCRADTRGWRAQCFSRTTLGIGCEAWVLRPVRLPPPPSRAIQTRPPVCTPCARHQQSSYTGKESHSGRRSATLCLGSHSAEATYQSRAPGRIVWRASATRRPAPASTLSG